MLIQSALSKDEEKILVVIPARDEEATVGDVVRGIKSEFQCDVVVVDDASTDTTFEKARDSGATVLPLSIRLGAWGATQTGLRYARDAGYSVVITLDADGQHHAHSIESLLAPIRNQQADVVIGSCPQRGSRARQSAWRFLRILSGFQIGDLTSGFRAYNRASIATLVSADSTLFDFQDMGVLLLLRHNGLKILEVPVDMCTRKSGKSRIFSSWLAVISYLIQTVVLCISKRNYGVITSK